MTRLYSAQKSAHPSPLLFTSPRPCLPRYNSLFNEILSTFWFASDKCFPFNGLIFNVLLDYVTLELFEHASSLIFTHSSSTSQQRFAIIQESSKLKSYLNSKEMTNFKTLKVNQICYKYFNVIYQNVRNDVLFLEIHMK